MFLSACAYGVQQATQRQSSLVSATHYFMFQVKYHYTKPIDHAAAHSAKADDKDHKCDTQSCNWIWMFLFSFQRRAHTVWSAACASFRNQAGIITVPPSRSLSVVANTFSDVNRCQITLQLDQRASLHDCIVCFC